MNTIQSDFDRIQQSIDDDQPEARAYLYVIDDTSMEIVPFRVNRTSPTGGFGTGIDSRQTDLHSLWTVVN
jgi:hypothetical protein